MTDGSLPWGTLFGLLFMTMGPIRAVSVFASFGDSDEAPGASSQAEQLASLRSRSLLPSF